MVLAFHNYEDDSTKQRDVILVEEDGVFKVRNRVDFKTIKEEHFETEDEVYLKYNELQ
jgi:hypothetical protein